MKAQNMHQLRVLGAKWQALYFWPLPSTSCQWFLCFGTRPRHQTRAPWLGLPRLKKAKLNFFTNRNILQTLKNEPLNIMVLHTSRTMDGPWINTVPVVSCIFDVSSSTGLEIEGCRTCWKDSPCHCPLLLANGTYALALDWDTKPAYHGLVRPDSRRQDLIFSQSVISYTLLRRNHWT